MIEKTIEINDKKITVKKQGIKKQMKVLDLLKDSEEVQKIISGLDTGKTEEETIGIMVSSIMPLIDKFIPYISEMLDNQLEEKYLSENCGITDYALIIYTILEVNQVKELLRYVKNAQALFQTEEK